jgi:CRP-like cAMP-binding protein
MVAYAAPSALLVVVHAPAVAAVLEVVRGVATLIVDVLAMTALQRSLAPDLISRVFGVMWALCLGGLTIGALTTPFLLDGFGLDTTILLDGLVVPVLVALVYPKLASLDKLASGNAEVLAPRVLVLEQLDIFAAASRPVLERVAAALEETVFEPGTTILRAGEPADALYVLTSGRVDVTTGAGPRGGRVKHIRYMTGPSYVGEIGLLENVPRTATVTAVEPTTAWRLDGDTFLAALTESSLSPSFVSGMSNRLRRTHPRHEVTLPAQRPLAEETAPTT